jgi:hypothetical protein
VKDFVFELWGFLKGLGLPSSQPLKDASLYYVTKSTIIPATKESKTVLLFESTIFLKAKEYCKFFAQEDNSRSWR